MLSPFSPLGCLRELYECSESQRRHSRKSAKRVQQPFGHPRLKLCGQTLPYSVSSSPAWPPRCIHSRDCES